MRRLLVLLVTILKKIVPRKYHPRAGRVYRRISTLWQGMRRHIDRFLKIVELRLKALIYAGNKFACPCCGAHFRKFLPFKYKYKAFKRLQPNVRCPMCSSHNRHRLLCIYLKEKTNLFREKLKVLHVSPAEILRQKFEALSNIDYISADLNSPFVRLKTDITDIRLPDNEVDCIICYHVLEHINDDEKAMRELFRVLKPGGWAILQVPVDQNREKTFEDASVALPEERERLFWYWDHVRLYGRDYADRLKHAGFEVKLDEYAKSLQNDVIRKYGLPKSEIIYYCTKPMCKTE